MRKLLLSLLTMLFLLPAAHAQNKTISGLVRNEKGDPVPFASVTLKGRKAGGITDRAGRFILQNISAGTTLVISAPGYALKEMLVKDSAVYSITLVSKTSDQLEEVAVTALGICRRILF